jgi:hypothetical protein
MMKRPRFLGFLFLAALLTLFVAGTAKGQDVSNEIRTALAMMDEELKSPFARIGLESMVLTIYRARIDLAPMGYERTDSFQQGFMASFSVFRERLARGEFQDLRSQVDDNTIQEMASSYRKNAEVFSRFQSAVMEKSELVRRQSPELIRRSLIYYALVLYAAGREQWEKAKKNTYIFPFC